MCKKFTPDELNKMDHKTKNDVIYQMQDRLDRLEQNYENLIEQVRLADRNRQIMMRPDIKLPQPFASWSNSL